MAATIMSDTELLSKPIVSVEGAAFVGEVDALIIDDEQLRVAGFLVGVGIYEASVLPFERVRAVGNDAVVVERAGDLCKLSEHPRLEALVRRDVALTGSAAISADGVTVGSVGDYYVDARDGSLAGIEFVAADRSVYPREPAVVPATAVRRVGPGIVILRQDYAQQLCKDSAALDRMARRRSLRPLRLLPLIAEDEAPATAPPETADERPVDRAAPAEDTPIESPGAAEGAAIQDADIPDESPQDVPAEAEAPAETPAPVQEELEAGTDPEPFVTDLTAPVQVISADTGGVAHHEVAEPAQPRHFLLGKLVARRVEAPDGTVIAEAGETVDATMIERARTADALLSLALCVE